MIRKDPGTDWDSFLTSGSSYGDENDLMNEPSITNSESGGSLNGVITSTAASTAAWATTTISDFLAGTSKSVLEHSYDHRHYNPEHVGRSEYEDDDYESHRAGEIVSTTTSTSASAT